MPTRMPTLAAIRRTHVEGADAEGQIRLLFIRDGGRIGLVQTASETADNADQFLARYLADMITDVDAPAVVVTVTRADGRPTHSDRQLWALLLVQLELTSTRILDLVMLGPDRAWSARRARPISPPRRRRVNRQSAARRSASRAAAP